MIEHTIPRLLLPTPPRKLDSINNEVWESAVKEALEYAKEASTAKS